ncbi:MAG TPA: hypothetical protein VMU45_01210 [Candidatus Eisenbacteria bacterium]|nr:hypothetical protein [Candidatus Eisenbacteria bacterium]
MKQVLVIAHATDAGAALVAARLRSELGAQAVHMVRPEVLSLARWSHRVDEHGRASTHLTLPGKPPMYSGDIGAALNRIRYLPVTRFQHSPQKDRDYAGVELQALVASWLAELGERAIHPVRRHPWVTPSLPQQYWASAAAACGLPVAPRTITTSQRGRSAGNGAHDATPSLRQSLPAEHIQAHCVVGDAMMRPAGSVLVAGDQFEGTLSRRYGAQCRMAARALGFPLMEFRFAPAAGDVALVDVDPLPPIDRPTIVEATCRLVISRMEQEAA